jgi:hypothetical protein
MKELNIPLWSKDSGNQLSHRAGLTQEQVDALRLLQPGDRLIVWVNNRRDKDTSPMANLKLFRDPNEDDSGGL